MGIGKRIGKDNAKGLKSAELTQNELVFVPEQPKYSLEDIILPNSIKDKILDIAEYAKNSKVVFEKWGLAETHKYSKRIGINLYGEV